MLYVANCNVFLAFGESNKAIGKLRQNHGTLFKCLQVSVKNLKTWRQEDVERNLQGGILTTDIDRLASAFKEIQDALEQQRQYRVCALCIVCCDILQLIRDHSRQPIMNGIFKMRVATVRSLTVSLRLT